MNEIKHADLPSLLTDIKDICHVAGKKILEIYGTDFAVEKKDDNSPLTLADMAAHNTICERLSELTPATPVLSEESSHISFKERQHWKQYWLVDPLDGTREFIKRNGEFSVNIALIEGKAPILGAIHIPVSGVSYTAALNYGAYKHEPDGSTLRIYVKKTHADKITIAGSRSHGNKKQTEFIKKLNDPAEGKADIYARFGPTSEWDSAAAQIIVEEAGGMVVDLNFKRIEYNTERSLLNPQFLVIADREFDWQQYIDH
jgi:3'(2'), 5'-bisphosphate nucleotidase